MKVLVLSTMVPFVKTGADELFECLVRNLQIAGIEAEGFRFPFTWKPAERLIEEMAIVRRVRVDNADRVIALTFPAYLVPWHDKVLWLLHQHRQAYDLLDAGQSNITKDARGGQIVGAIRAADRLAFAEAKRIHTTAPITSRRLMHYNGVSSSVLQRPLNDPGLFLGGEAEGYVLAIGRVNAGHRQHLLIRALRHAPGTRLVVAGLPDTAAEVDRLRRIVVEEGVEERVTLDLRCLPRSDLARLVNGALAVAYLPSDDDPLGCCRILEAFQAGKPVLTAADAGDVLEFVRNGETGLVTLPDPEALGSGMATLTGDPGRAGSLGQAGREAVRAEGRTWLAAIEKLLA